MHGAMETDRRTARSAGVRGAALLGLGVLLTAAVPGRAEARTMPGDTTRTLMRVPAGDGLLHTLYLSRLAEAALTRRTELKVMLELDAPSEARVATAYARRYGISEELSARIVRVARRERLDPELGFRLVRAESEFRTRAHGPSGGLGLCQLMPSTARMIDRSVDTHAEVLDPETNLRLGFRYLHEMIERYHGDVRLGLLAYNRGEVAVDRALRRGRDPENGYSHRVLGTRTEHPYRGDGVLEAEPDGS